MRHTALLIRLSQRLTARTVAGFAGVITAGFLALSGTLLFASGRDATLQAKQGAENIAAAVAQDIARNVELYDLSLQAVARGLRMPGLDDLDPDLKRMILFDRAAYARNLGFINVLDKNGDVIADSMFRTPRSGNFASRDYFQAHMRDPRDDLFIGRPFLTGPGQPATIPLSRRLSRPDGGFDGVVVGSIRLAYFRELFSHLALGAHGSIALLRSDGLVLMRLPFNPDDIGRSLPANSAFLQAIAAGRAGLSGREPGDPVARNYVFRHVGDLPLVVSVGFAQADIDAPWLGKALVVLAALLALCLVNVAVILLLRFALHRQQQAETATRMASDEASRFLATVSHDLRTPLASIMGYAELIEAEDDLQPAQASRLTALIDAAEHMRDVIARILDISHPAALANLPRPQDTDIDALASGCRGMIELAAASKGLRLSCRVAAMAPRRAMIDGAQVREVLLNLLNNAVKYTGQGSVDLRVSGDRRRLRFEVADTGPGIPVEKQTRLFHAGDRLGAETGPAEGFGLGLVSAARLVAGMGGQIGYEPNRSGGSLFWFEIPVGEHVSPPARPAAASRVTTSPQRVLLVDDSAASREIAGGFLRAAGHQVTEATDGAEALQRATEEAFDVVLMDMRMPRLGGLEAARGIRSLPPPRNQVTIVAMTADMAASRPDSHLAACFDLHLPKPFTCRELLRVVEQAASLPSARARTGRHGPDTAVASGFSDPLLDETELAQLAQRLSRDNLEAHLLDFATRVRQLLAMLSGVGEDAGALRDLAHEMIGGAGLLGLRQLAAALRRYDAAEDGAAAAAAGELARVATESLHVLEQYAGVEPACETGDSA